MLVVKALFILNAILVLSWNSYAMTYCEFGISIEVVV